MQQWSRDPVVVNHCPRLKMPLSFLLQSWLGFQPMLLVMTGVTAAGTYIAMPKDPAAHQAILQIWLQVHPGPCCQRRVLLVAPPLSLLLHLLLLPDVATNLRHLRVAVSARYCLAYSVKGPTSRRMCIGSRTACSKVLCLGSCQPCSCTNKGSSIAMFRPPAIFGTSFGCGVSTVPLNRAGACRPGLEYSFRHDDVVLSCRKRGLACLQEFSWGEDELEMRRIERMSSMQCTQLQKEPMFCFETSLKVRCIALQTLKSVCWLHPAVCRGFRRPVGTGS